MTPPAPMTVEDIIFKYLLAGEDDKRAPQMRRELEAMLRAAEWRGEVGGMREAAKLIESQFWKADQECDTCGHIPEKDVARFVSQKADSLEKEG